MTSKKFAVACLVILAAITASPKDLGKLADANNGFAFDLLKQIAKEEPGSNIFISPFSVSTVLQMLGNGAAGRTKAEIQDVLKTENLPPDELNADCKLLNQSLKSQTNVILDLADSIWYQQGFQLKSDFVSANKNFFETELAPVDFENPKSADIINNWADKATRGKIERVVSFPFPPLTRVILANAIYFKGKWSEPFDKTLTKPRDFHLSPGNTKQVPMMNRSDEFGYQENDDFQAVELPYAGNRLKMVLFLPATNSSPEKLLENFSGQSWHEKILSGFGDREGTVTFPKFKLDYNVGLNNPLKALGMRQAFDVQTADFSAMADEPLFVSAVAQKSYIAVDEEGTEATAVTTVGFVSAVDIPQNPFEMIVDRPFFFVIADSRTQSILFMGIVNDPKP